MCAGSVKWKWLALRIWTESFNSLSKANELQSKEKQVQGLINGLKWRIKYGAHMISDWSTVLVSLSRAT